MKHCIEPTDFSKEEILELISLAEDMITSPSKYQDVCRGKQLATLFYEPSTRTRLSFTSAMLALGGSVLGFSDAQSSSVSKGETVADTVRVISEYADIIAMRHHKEGSALVASHYGSIPVINAGDGSHSHPTQTLTDLLTIHRELGRLNKLTIGLCGDLKYGRTVHSLIKAMSNFEAIHFVLISSEELKLPQYMLEELRSNKQITFSQANKIEEVISQLDVLYMTRVQRERFACLEDYERCKDDFILDKKLLDLASKDMIVLHPLPRVNEITADVDNDPRASYFRQAGNGKFIRMALIYTLLQQGKLDKTNYQVPRLSADYHLDAPRCQNPACISTIEPIKALALKSDDRLRCAYCESIL